MGMNNGDSFMDQLRKYVLKKQNTNKTRKYHTNRAQY